MVLDSSETLMCLYLTFCSLCLRIHRKPCWDTHSEGVRLTSARLMILEMTALETPGCLFFEFALGTERLN